MCFPNILQKGVTEPDNSQLRGSAMCGKAAKLVTVVVISVGILSLFLHQPFANACTGIMLRNSDGTIVHGRTLEFGIVVDTMIAIVPRGYEFVAQSAGRTGNEIQVKIRCRRGNHV